jgi:PAS domain-containing protein
LDPALRKVGVDEHVIAPVVLAIAFGAYCWRKTTQLQREVEERKETEEALRSSEERFRSLVQNASDVILIMEADRSVRYISPAVERVLGYRPEDDIGQDNFTPVHPDDMARLQEVVAKAVRNPGTTFPPGVAP